MRELIYKDEAYKAIDNCIRDGWDRISPSEAKMNIHQLVSDVNEADRPQGEWIDEGRNLWGCSNCGMEIYSESERDRNEFHKWCSRCGARMKGADDVLEGDRCK